MIYSFFVLDIQSVLISALIKYAKHGTSRNCQEAALSSVEISMTRRIWKLRYVIQTQGCKDESRAKKQWLVEEELLVLDKDHKKFL